MTTRPNPQRDHWSRTYATRSDFLGAVPRVVGRAALARFQAAGAAAAAVRRHDAAIVNRIEEER